MAPNFDPRDNYQAIYHLQEIGAILKKERYHLEEAGKLMDQAFEDALSLLYQKIRSLKIYMNNYLWKDYIAIYDKYEDLVKNFTTFQTTKAQKEIINKMKEDLAVYFSQKNLKEFYDKVYIGQYDEDIYNKYLDINKVIEDLKSIRRKLDKGLHRFNVESFTRKWATDLEQMITSTKNACKESFFIDSNLYNQHETHMMRMPVYTPKDPVNITCLVNLEGFSSSFITRVSNDTYLTISDNRVVHTLNPIQHFRIIKELKTGEESINSFAILEYENKISAEPIYFVLLGGNDDFPSLELWDCIHDKCLCSLEDIHSYAVSILKVLKREKQGASQLFYLASGSADGYIKLWIVTITQINDNLDFQADFQLKTKVYAHDHYISGILNIPRCDRFPSAFLISASHDKSIYVLEWEKYLEEHEAKAKEDDTELLLEDQDEEILQKYSEKHINVHEAKINSIVLLNDQEDCSDLEFFATGSGDGMITIWDIFSREVIKKISNNKRPVSAMEYLKKGRIACSANDRSLKLFHVFVWNWKTGSLILSLADHQAPVQRIVSLEKDVFASCDKNKVIRIWQFE